MALLQALTIAVMALILAPGYSFYFDVTPKVVVLLAGSVIVVNFVVDLAYFALDPRIGRDR